MGVYLNGLLLGLSMIVALGPQNMFLIKQGVLGKFVLLAVLVCFFCDSLLLTVSIFGAHRIVTMHQNLQLILGVTGIIFLSYYGLRSFYSAYKGQIEPSQQDKVAETSWQIALLALGFSLLNPHAIMDTFFLVGGASTRFESQKHWFLLGVMSASFAWFASIALITKRYASILSSPKVWRGIEFFSGLIMTFLAIKMALSI